MSREFKNVVVIGLGLAGADAAKATAKTLPATHRVVAISGTESAYFTVAALRAAVVPEYEDNIILPLDRVFPEGSRHIVLAGTNVVSLASHSVKVDTLHPGFELDIPFDYVIIATGSTYPFPCRAPNDSSLQGVKAEFEKLQTQIRSSTSCLVLGGGPVGIEIAGEIAAHYGKNTKKITLVNSGDSLMSGFQPKLGQNLQSQLQHLGVTVLHDVKVEGDELKTGTVEKQTFKLSNGEQVEADFVFVGFGNKPNSELIKDFDTSIVNAQGRVKVKPTLQIQTTDGSLDHMFVVGDVTDLDETKLWYKAQGHAPVVAANIAALATSKVISKSYAVGQPLIVVGMGENGGASQLFFGFVFGAWFTAMAKSKHLFVPKFKALYGY